MHEDVLDLDHLAQVESVMALSNGHIGLRANLEEGEPAGLPGTYLNAFYEVRPLPYAEAGYGYPEDGQTIVNVTDGKLIRLLVDDEPFDIRYGELLAHKRRLDLRTGLLHREVHWRSPAGRAIKLRTTRLVSFTHRAIAAIDYEVEACDEGETRIVVQSELVANEPLPDQSEDPRAAAALRAPLVAEDHDSYDMTAVLMHRTARERAAHGGRHGPLGRRARGHDLPHRRQRGPRPRRRSTPRSTQGETLRVDEAAGLRLVEPALARGAARPDRGRARRPRKRTGWDGLVAEQRAYLDDFWTGADVEIDGDSGLQQAVRFGIFHTLQAGARVGGARDPGQGADRARLRRPRLLGHRGLRAAHAQLHRAVGGGRRAGLARLDARPGDGRAPSSSGSHGAAFPWRTIRGQECSAYWPAGTAAFHINADIAARGAAPRRTPPATSRSRSPRRCRCSCRPRGCGARSATTTRPAPSTSTA